MSASTAPSGVAKRPAPNSGADGFEDDLDARHAAELASLDRLATLLDSQWRIPGIGVRFGIDAVAGLLPVVGDAGSALVSAWLISRARGLGVPGHVVAKMGANVVLDAVVGSIPLVGSVVDVFYKANRQNIRLIREHLVKEHARRKRG